MAKDTKKKNSSKTDIIENGEDLAPSAPTREIKEGELEVRKNVDNGIR